MKLTVILGTSGEASFDISLFDNSFVRKWIKEFQWCLDNCKLNQDEAFSGLLTLHEASEHLHSACVIINKYLKNFIDIKSDFLNQNQEYFNYLHLKFEQLSGEFGKPTRLFSIANVELKKAIRDLNFYVHRIEKKKDRIDALYISFDKNSYRRIPFEIHDYEFCEFKLAPGTLFVHYVELGKEFIDIFEDNLTMDYKNLKNLHYYSGESVLIFKPYDPFSNTEYFNFLKSNLKDPYDKKLGHGKLPLGTVTDIDYTLNLISQYRHIKEILVKD